MSFYLKKKSQNEVNMIIDAQMDVKHQRNVSYLE